MFMELTKRQQRAGGCGCVCVCEGWGGGDGGGDKITSSYLELCAKVTLGAFLLFLLNISTQSILFLSTHLFY